MVYTGFLGVVQTNAKVTYYKNHLSEGITNKTPTGRCQPLEELHAYVLVLSVCFVQPRCPNKCFLKTRTFHATLEYWNLGTFQLRNPETLQPACNPGIHGSFTISLRLCWGIFWSKSTVLWIIVARVKVQR